MSAPSIACIGVIGKHDNPLHISLFPPFRDHKPAELEFAFLLNASLDLFDARARDRNRVGQDFGMLQAINERLSIWGWQTGTGVRFAIIIDAWGKRGLRGGDIEGLEGKKSAARATADADLKPAFKALQTAYVHLLQNPFYTPDEQPPMAVAHGKGRGGQITSKKFIQEVEKIGDSWKLGMVASS